MYDAPTDGLIYYEKDQRKLREEAIQYADERTEHAQEPTLPAPQPVPYPVRWWWPE